MSDNNEHIVEAYKKASKALDGMRNEEVCVVLGCIVAEIAHNQEALIYAALATVGIHAMGSAKCTNDQQKAN